MLDVTTVPQERMTAGGDQLTVKQQVVGRRRCNLSNKILESCLPKMVSPIMSGATVIF